MDDFRPGMIVTYQANFERPPWPAVICKDDMVPRVLLNKRPRAYVLPILLLGKLEVRWVVRDNLRINNDMQCPEDLARKHNQLQDAYNSWITAVVDLPALPHLTLPHWKAVIKAAYGEGNMQADEDEHKEVEEEKGEEDPDSGSNINLTHAIQASLADLNPLKRSSSAAGLSSATDSVTRCRMSPGASGLVIQARDQPQVGSSLTFRFLPTLPTPSPSSDEKVIDLDGLCSPVIVSSGIVGHLTPTSTPLMDGADPTTLDEELKQEFSRWQIEPGPELFDIPYSAITRRPHLLQMNLIYSDRDGGREVIKPSSPRINPVNFRPAAEFLSSGNFRDPVHDEEGNELDGDEAKTEMIAVCAGAWDVANLLRLDDLMAKVIEKMVELQPWPLQEALLFATRIYDASGPPEEFEDVPDQLMRKMVSGFLANNFWTYLRYHESTFREKLQQFPELRKHVHNRIAENADDEFKRT